MKEILFVSLLLWIVISDIRTMTIPDIAIFIGLCLGVYFNRELAVLGFAVGFVSMYLVNAIGYRIFYRDCYGGGDIKLMGMVGAFMGWKVALLTFLIAPILSFFLGMIFKIEFDANVIPIAPCIALASIASIFL